jgi:excisionase family DNA binding protein
MMTRQALEYTHEESGTSAQRWLMTIPEYAARCSVCSRTVQNWIRFKAIPILKLGRSVRIDPQRADQALRKFEVRAAGDRKGARE